MLGIALTNAVSGLKVNQQSLAVISQNVANANNPEYTRQIVNQESVSLGTAVGNGVRINEITRSLDDFVSKAVIVRSSDLNKTKTISEYYKQAELFYGQPGSNNSIDTYMDNLFNSFNVLQSNPKNASIKQGTVAAASQVASELSTLAANIEEQRFQADKAIEVAVDTVNFHISQIKELNSAILSAKSNNISVNALQDKVTTSLKAIAEQVDINYTFDEFDTVSVSTAGGRTLISNSNVYELSYRSTTSVNNFYDDLELNPIELYSVSLDGIRSENPTATLATAGSEDTITTTFTSGKIKALMEIRDVLLPDMLTQLDNLAADLRDEINALHNKGSSFPPAQTLTGTRLIDPTAATEWEGSAMIAALNSDGTAISSPYASDLPNGMVPLVLDLSSLSDGNGVGKPTFQTIIDEINQYYGAPQNRVNIGPLNNITLASKSEALDGNSGTFSFDLDISNYSAGDASVVVTGVTVNGSASVTVPSSFPTSATTVENGTKSRELAFTLDMSSGTLTSYNVAVAVQVTNADGDVFTDTITYTIAEATEDLMNRRYAPQSVSGSGDATIETPSSTDAILRAKLVDTDGNEVSKDADTGDYLESGYLVIEGVSSSNRVALTELDSQESGNATTNIDATDFGFSHYFGLNNFFVDESDGTSSNGAALAIKVRDDIVENPSLIAMAELFRADTDDANADYTYEIGESSASVIDDIVALNLENRTFSEAGSLPQIAVTFSGYASQILGYIASVTKLAEADYNQSELIHSGFVEKDANIRGVNIDEEMANTIIFQNAYAANARVISVVNQMFDDLIQSF